MHNTLMAKQYEEETNMKVDGNLGKKPAGARWHISPSFYKTTPQGMIFVWGGDIWIKSNKSRELLEAEVLRDIYCSPSGISDGASYMRRINKTLTINEYRALIYIKVYDMFLEETANKMGVCHSSVHKYVRSAEQKIRGWGKSLKVSRESDDIVSNNHKS